MVDYNFIKRCKNYNIKKSKGFKYETIVKRSMNKIKKLDKKINNDCYYHDYVRPYVLDRSFNDYLNGKISKNEYDEKKFFFL